MGQWNLVRGHFLFLPILTLFYSLQKRLFQTRSLSWYRYLLMLLAFWFLSLLSLHHALLLTLLILILLLSNQLELPTSPSEGWQKSPKQLLNWTYRGITLVSLAPGWVYLFLRYYQGPEQVYYQQNIASQPAVLQEILTTFSLPYQSFLDWLKSGFSGQNSWQRPFPQFIQTMQSWGADLAWLWSIYLWLIIFLILAGFLVAIWLQFQEQAKRNQLITAALWLTPVSLLLSLGVNGPTSTLANLFFLFPTSYAFRDPGKFYSFFLVLWVILLLYSWQFLPRLAKALTESLITLLVLLQIGLFLPLSQHLPYLSWPQLFSNLNQICSTETDQRVLYLPFETYISSSLSQTFLVNPSLYALQCPRLAPDLLRLKLAESQQPIIFQADSDSLQIYQQLQAIQNEKDPEDAWKMFFGLAARHQIRHVLIDETVTFQAETWLKILSQHATLRKQENQLYWFELQGF